MLTEVLMALNCRKFAVVNQNTLAGLRLADVTGFPAHPNKDNVDGETYARFCAAMDSVRKRLGLADFAELDALFNYAYWGMSS